jgi:hypothetical protein
MSSASQPGSESQLPKDLKFAIIKAELHNSVCVSNKLITKVFAGFLDDSIVTKVVNSLQKK